jgi:adhesin transport system outer membrane protein
VVSRVPDTQPCKQEQGLVVAFDAGVEFSPQQAVLTPDGEKELLQMVDKINGRYKTAKSVKVKVVGYANDSEEERRNVRLALERAQAVSAYLINQGLSKESLVHEAKGAQKHTTGLAPSLSGRRVEIAVSVEIR